MIYALTFFGIYAFIIMCNAYSIMHKESLLHKEVGNQYWESVCRLNEQNRDLIRQLEEQKFLNADLKERGMVRSPEANFYIPMPRTIKKEIVRFHCETRTAGLQLKHLDTESYTKFIVERLYRQLMEGLMDKKAMHITTEDGFVRGEIMVAI